MGTKFEYAVHLLASSPVSSSSRTKTFSFHCVNDQQKITKRRSEIREKSREERRNSQFSESKQEEELMDRNEEIQSMESIKKTMQMQEDIFKQQVRELHRVYNAQKMLMAEVKKQAEQNRICGPLTTATSLTNKNSMDWPCQAFPSHGNDPSPSPRNLDLERPAAKGDVSSHGGQLGDGCSMEDDEVELTLSIGGKMSKRKPKIEVEKKFGSSLSIESDRSGPAPDSSGATEISDHERKRPHWLFQV